ncbi:MAG: ABC transporter substrate-binding protein [Chlorobiales bacterium]|nr:ABC transporter substrate-binding protein [Chlorobiales bacterium]
MKRHFQKRNRRTWNVGILGCLVLCLSLAACAKREDKGTSQFAPLKGGIKQGGVFRTNAVSDISSLDPARMAKLSEVLVGHQVYDLLVNLNDSTLDFEPMLAKRWTVSDDGLTYTFHLRDDVYFHDDPCFPGGKGRKLTAADIKYSLTRSVDARVQSLGSEFFTTCVLGAEAYYDATIEAIKTKSEPSVKEVAGYLAPNDTTFIVKLSEPYAPFLYHLTTGFAYITCREAAEKYGKGLARHPVGTGPFKFASWMEDREIELVRNPNYWATDAFGNRLPYLEGVRYRFIKEASAQLLEFQRGELEESLGIPQEFAAQVLDENGQAKGDFKKYVLKTTPELRIDYIAMQTQAEPFNNLKLRQAISAAIDREKIVRYVLKNQVAPATGIVAKGLKGYDNSALLMVAYDPARAKQLLAEAGYPGGKGLPPLVLNTFVGAKYAYNKEVAEAVQAMLREIGIEVKIEQAEYSTHLQQAYLGKFKIFLASWGADYPEPETFLNLVYGKVVPKSPDGESYLNLSRYKSEAFDKVYSEALKISDQTKRYELYKKAEQLALSDAPIILTYHRLSYRFQQPYVRNYPINSMDRRDYRQVWLDK